MKRKKLDWDAVLMNSLIVLLILISVLSVGIIRDYVGYVGYHDAKGGVITKLELFQMFPASAWNGIFGIVIEASAINTTWTIDAEPAGMSEINPIFTCLEPGIDHELYATYLHTSNITWMNVTAGTTQMVDDFVGIGYNESMSATQTFTDNMTIELGEKTITGIPSTYMYQYNIQGSTAFQVGILQFEGDIIMVARIRDDYITGYRPDKNNLNFEMMVPVPFNLSRLKYNLYIDPFDTCPAGAAGEDFEEGNVYGWVTDSDTGVFLENVLVSIERKIYVTAADGFYNISGLQPGDYYVVAIKTGFVNYVGNATVYENSSTEHNISMEIYEEPLTGTGPGVGTGVGPGEDDPGDSTKSGEGPGIGPGVGPGIGPFIEKPEEFGKDHWISLDRLKKKIRLETFFTENLLIFNFRKEAVDVNIKVTGNASRILELGATSAVIDENDYGNISIRGLGIEKGVFTGKIEVSGDFNDSLPVEITVTDEDKLPVEALLMDLEVLTQKPLPGNNFRFQLDLQNLLIEEHYDVWLEYFIRGVESSNANNTLYLGNDTITILTTESVIKEVVIPPDFAKGDYYLVVEAYYLDLYSRTSTVFELFEPFYQHKAFGLLEIWKILLALGIIALIIGTILYIRHKIESQKRFHAKVEYNLLPQKGPRSIYVGKIAETEKDTYFDMDKLTVHSIIAGSTGGGKTIAGQVIIEECLMKDVAVIVFDPTAQWTGMLRKCQDEKMMSFYPRFGLSKKDSKAFSGNIRAIKNPREKIDLKAYWKPGEIQVFTINTLDPSGIDTFVANTVREVFHSNLQEYRGLRFMMVYDEVHRLLPKFGGSGEGFVQIERACREFRKWGIGVMLLSQVLADFVGQIKANINTEVQMKTRDEGDLNRIKTKYGESFIQELVKSPVGSGMVQNSSWNRGRPYYVTFRPILHSVVRLADEELDKYNKYNKMVDDLDYQLEQLEKEGQDVFDLKLELKLALDKIKQGGFNMVEIYLEGLKPRIEKIWKTIGKKPKKREVELVSEEEIKKSIKSAEEDSEKAKAEEKAGEKKEEEKKSLGINDDVPPDKILKLSNGMLVNKLHNLVDEIKAMKEADFKKHVAEGKNDFSDWIRTAIGNDKWADIADQILTKEDYVKFLEILDQGKEKEFKPATKREKPYSSKEAQPAEQKEETKPEQKLPAQTQQQVQQPESEKQPQQTSQKQIQQQAQQPQSQPQPQQPQKQTQAEWQKKLMTLKTSEEKINYLKGLLEQSQDDKNIMFSLAAEHHRIKDYTNAEVYYKKIIENEPNNLKTLYYLGSVYNAQKKYQEALDIYNKIIKIKPDYPKVQQYIDSIKNILSKQQ